MASSGSQHWQSAADEDEDELDELLLEDEGDRLDVEVDEDDEDALLADRDDADDCDKED